ncbi:hypothetical protein [Saccharopolyspora pogona]|uniref:hypothetical protein n=1 Tax=Saccharopolyspora pogona TaxID=333966 RepID=UPI001688DDD6|nr:hypothetical protein [Saccharopolyspora pogona]
MPFSTVSPCGTTLTPVPAEVDLDQLLDAVIASIYVGTAQRAWAPLAPDNPFTDQELKGT